MSNDDEYAADSEFVPGQGVWHPVPDNSEYDGEGTAPYPLPDLDALGNRPDPLAAPGEGIPPPWSGAPAYGSETPAYPAYQDSPYPAPQPGGYDDPLFGPNPVPDQEPGYSAYPQDPYPAGQGGFQPGGQQPSVPGDGPGADGAQVGMPLFRDSPGEGAYSGEHGGVGPQGPDSRMRDSQFEGQQFQGVQHSDSPLGDSQFQGQQFQGGQLPEPPLQDSQFQDSQFQGGQRPDSQVQDAPLQDQQFNDPQSGGPGAASPLGQEAFPQGPFPGDAAGGPVAEPAPRRVSLSEAMRQGALSREGSASERPPADGRPGPFAPGAEPFLQGPQSHPGEQQQYGTPDGPQPYDPESYEPPGRQPHPEDPAGGGPPRGPLPGTASLQDALSRREPSPGTGGSPLPEPAHQAQQNGQPPLEPGLRGPEDGPPDARPEDPAEGRFAGGHSAEGRPAAGEFAQDRPAEGQFAAGEFAAGEFAEGPSAEGRPANGQFAEDRPPEGQFAEEGPAHGPFAMGPSGEDRPIEGHSAEGRPAESSPPTAEPAPGPQEPAPFPAGGFVSPVEGPVADGDDGDETGSIPWPPEGDAAPPEGAPAPGLEHPLVSYVLRVNGTDRPVTDAWLGESLLYVLRERLGLAGAKDGCEQGECGACSVQVDGRLVASCLVPAATAAGCEVRTVEGLATDGVPSDVQRALAASGAVQCGYCVPGLAMAVSDLLAGNHNPTELEARQALSGNLCRCTGYRGVLAAVREVIADREEAAQAAKSGESVHIPHQAGPEDHGSPNGWTTGGNS